MPAEILIIDDEQSILRTLRIMLELEGYDVVTATTGREGLDQITEYSDTLRTLNSRAESLFPQLSEQDWISYKDRWRVFGEQAALRWVIQKYGQN